MRIFGLTKPKKAPEVLDFEDILQDPDRLSASPTLYELDEILTALRPFDPMGVRLTRKQLKWTAKASRKYLGIDYQHPYRKP